MNPNTNKWNKLRYTLYTPIYDLVARIFKSSRKKSIDSLNIKRGDRVLIIGAGTGLDIEFIPNECEIVATDITPSMLGKIKKGNKNIKTMVMDGQALSFKNSSFDAVILHLILAVIPNPNKCLKEAERVLKKGGNIAIFDKFVRKNIKVSIFRKILNIFTNLLFSDITRNFESILKSTSLDTISDIDADFNGNFRLIRVNKK